MSKIAVIFPGIGYTKDRPLLYYAGRIVLAQGYELVHLDFSGIKWSKEDLKNHKRLMEILSECLDRTEKALAGIDIVSAESLLFISKSIGTVIATAYAQKKDLRARQICFTPLEYISNFAEEGNGIIFYGTADPLIDPDAVDRICKNKKLEAHRFDDANHSLETKDVMANIDILKQVLQRVDEYVAGRSIYTYKVQLRDGSLSSLAEYRGKVLLIVNTATGCGFTPQYEALEHMYRAYRADGFEVLDFPCNQFDRQAPGTSEEIHNFCTSRYDISFPQFQKIDVNGEHELELYTYLKSKKGFHGFGDSPDAAFMKRKLEAINPDYENNSDIKWNFTKFLVDRDGKVLSRFEPTEDMGKVEKAVREAVQR